MVFYNQCFKVLFCGFELSEIWNDQESISFPVFQQWYQDQMFHKRKQDAEKEAEHAVELSELLDWPSER